MRKSFMHKKRFYFEYLNTFGKFLPVPNILNAELNMCFIRMLLLLLWMQRTWIFYSITGVKYAESCFLTGVMSWHSWARWLSANRRRFGWGMFSAADKWALSAVMSDHSGRMGKWPAAVPNLEQKHRHPWMINAGFWGCFDESKRKTVNITRTNLCVCT